MEKKISLIILIPLQAADKGPVFLGQVCVGLWVIYESFLYRIELQ